MYQGEELGLPEVEDLPLEHLQDPMHFQSGGTDPGRDGCRVPLPWDGTQPPYGFGPDGSTPWLPQPASWAALSVAAEHGRPTSMLALYRDVIAVRRERLVGGDEPLALARRRADGVLAFASRRLGVRRQPVPRSCPAACRDRPDHQWTTGRRPAPVDTAAWIHLDNHQPDPEQ